MSMSKKKKNGDRISLLPDSLLHHILSFLNTKVVVQTCVLSKRWRTVWTRIPTLNFDFDSFPFEGLSGYDDIYISIETSFKDFIFKVLSKHCGPCITKLSYSSPDDYEETVQVVEMLVCYAGCHTVQELRLNTGMVFYENWPFCLRTCSSLTVLKMVCEFVDGWGSLTLPSLRILDLEFNFGSDADYKFNKEYKGMKMFSGCPNLESLVLVDFHFDSISICAPKLEHFELFGCFERGVSFPKMELLAPSLKSVNFINILPTVKSASEFLSIDKVNIDTDDYHFEWRGSICQKTTKKFSELLRVFHNARSFTVPLKAIEVLPSVRGSSFHNLKHLKLTTEEEEKRIVIDLPSSTYAFLQNCPNLELLVIEPHVDPWSRTNTKHYKEPRTPMLCRREV